MGRLFNTVHRLSHLAERKTSTIKSYILAIKSVLLEIDYEVSEDRYLMTSLIRACKYHQNKVRLHLPIQKDMLNMLLTQVDQIFL